jgi:hypothetical protein
MFDDELIAPNVTPNLDDAKVGIDRRAIDQGTGNVASISLAWRTALLSPPEAIRLTSRELADKFGPALTATWPLRLEPTSAVSNAVRPLIA